MAPLSPAKQADEPLDCNLARKYHCEAANAMEEWLQLNYYEDVLIGLCAKATSITTSIGFDCIN